MNEFSVFIFFPDGWHICEGAHLEAQAAVELAKRITERPAVLLGMIRRVIITDSDDYCVFEWKWKEGITFPPQANIAAGRAA